MGIKNFYLTCRYGFDEHNKDKVKFFLNLTYMQRRAKQYYICRCAPTRLRENLITIKINILNEIFQRFDTPLFSSPVFLNGF